MKRIVICLLLLTEIGNASGNKNKVYPSEYEWAGTGSPSKSIGVSSKTYKVSEAKTQGVDDKGNLSDNLSIYSVKRFDCGLDKEFCEDFAEAMNEAHRRRLENASPYKSFIATFNNAPTGN